MTQKEEAVKVVRGTYVPAEMESKKAVTKTEEEVRKAIEYDRTRIGIELYNGPGWHEDVTADAIRLFAHGIGDDSLLYNDEEYAKKTRWGALIAPPGFVAAVNGATSNGRFPMLTTYLDNRRDNLLGRSESERAHPKYGETPAGRKVYSWNQGYLWPGYEENRIKGIGSMVEGAFGGVRYEFHEVLKKGDKVRFDFRLASVEEKRGRIGRTMIKRTFLSNYRNQDNRIVARMYFYHFMMPFNQLQYPARQGLGKQYPYTLDELKQIKEDLLKNDVRGANPRYWEDVQEGDAITPRVLGPILMTDMIAFEAGQGPHTTALDPGRRWRRPEDLLLDSSHADAGSGVDSGFGGGNMQGPCAVHWAFPTITNWMGDDAFLEVMDVQLRKPLLFFDTVWFTGKVVRKYVEGGYYHHHKVEIDFEGHNQLKEGPGSGTVYVGKAIVELPSRTEDSAVHPKVV